MAAGTDFQRKLSMGRRGWGEGWSPGKEGGIARLLGRGSEDDRGKMPQKMRGFIRQQIFVGNMIILVRIS